MNQHNNNRILRTTFQRGFSIHFVTLNAYYLNQFLKFLYLWKAALTFWYHQHQQSKLNCRPSWSKNFHCAKQSNWDHLSKIGIMHLCCHGSIHDFLKWFALLGLKLSFRTEFIKRSKFLRFQWNSKILFVTCRARFQGYFSIWFIYETNV